jgi:hypothetical protein
MAIMINDSSRYAAAAATAGQALSLAVRAEALADRRGYGELQELPAFGCERAGCANWEPFLPIRFTGKTSGPGLAPKGLPQDR